MTSSTNALVRRSVVLMLITVIVLVSVTTTLQTMSTSQMAVADTATSKGYGDFSTSAQATYPVKSHSSNLQTLPVANEKVAPHVEKLLVVKAKLPDREFTTSMAKINTTMIDDVKSYYKEISFNQTVIETTVMKFNYTMPHPENYYATGATQAAELVQYALTQAKDDVDEIGGYSVFRHIVVMHSGEDQAMPPNNANAMVSEFIYKEGAPLFMIGVVAIMNASIVSNRDPLGVIVHEIGHSMGLPDLYDYDKSASGDRDDFVGPWDLMAEGAWNPRPDGTSPSYLTTWCKAKLGWINSSRIVSITQLSIQSGHNVTVLLPPQELASGTQAIRVLLTNGSYYLVENRQKIGYDTGLPAVGVLVLYCVDSLGSGDGPVRLMSSRHPDLTVGAPYNVGIVTSDDFFGDEHADIGIKVLNKWANGTFKVLVGPRASVYNAASEYVSLANIPIAIVVVGIVAFLGVVLVVYLKKGREKTVKSDGSIPVIKLS